MPLFLVLSGINSYTAVPENEVDGRYVCLLMRLLGNVPLNQCYIARIFQNWSRPTAYEE